MGESMARLRIGLIGYGLWTRGAYIPALRHDGRAEIVSVAAHSRTTRDRVRSELGTDVGVYGSIEDLLNGPRLDAVMIAVPDTVHEKALLTTLESGLAVFYEPPITDTRRNIPFVMEQLLAARQITFADLELGLIPAVGRASELIHSGTIGSVQTASIRLQSGWGPVAGYDLCNFNHLCTWYVDVLNRILSRSPSRVLLLDGHGTPGRRQSQSTGHLDYDGVLGTLQANIASVGTLEITVEINADDGDLRIDLMTGDLLLRSRRQPEWRTEHWPALKPYADWPGMHESVRTFLDALETQDARENTALDVARLQLIGLAAEASKDSGTWSEVGNLSTILTQSE